MESTELEISSYISSKEEVRESRAHIVYNGCASRISEIGLELYPISEFDLGEGLPFSPVDFPNAGDKWSWRSGKIFQVGTLRYRYLYLPKHFKAPNVD